MLSDDNAATIARGVNDALLLELLWRDEYKAARADNLSTQRMQQIAEALATLQADLPELIEDSRRGNPRGDFSETENLLKMVSRHQGIIDAYPRRKKGRGRSHEKMFAANLAEKVRNFWGEAATKKAVDAFAADALTWLIGRPCRPRKRLFGKRESAGQKRADLCPVSTDARCGHLCSIGEARRRAEAKRHRHMSKSMTTEQEISLRGNFLKYYIR